MQFFIAYIKIIYIFAASFIKHLGIMVSLNKISIKGFRNIDSFSIDLQDITSLLAPNNYGKSNAMAAISFGFHFIKRLPKTKLRMMGDQSCISINKMVAGKPFVFEVEGSIDDTTEFIYGFKFDWKRNRKNNVEEDSDGQIVAEVLKIKTKNGEKPKYTKLIYRTESTKAKYIPSPSGRCDKELNIDSNELVLNKLYNYDDLFYHNYIEAIRKIEVRGVDTLSDPEEFFAPRLTVREGRQRLILGYDLAQYLYELKQKDKDTFEYLISSITNLIPTIETINPIVINKLDLKIDKDAPFELPDQYDVIVKEKNNNQQTRFQYLSTGSMKLLNLLTKIIKAQKDGVQLLLVEELENSIHPRLLQSLLSSIKDFLGDTKLLFTSHSPNLVKYLSAPQLYIGLPSEKGFVDFHTLKTTKVSHVLKIAAAGEMSLGEYLFDLMLDMECDQDLISEFFAKN